MDFIKNLPSKKIEINWNKNPIKMDRLLSFLTVNVSASKNHLGASNGWTEHLGENNLIIGGGVVNGIEYLNSLQYGRKLSNSYNNYVNVFYLLDILNEEGKKFFIEYYKEEIEEEKALECKKIEKLEEELKNIRNISKERKLFWENL